jgi:PhnB protein
MAADSAPHAEVTVGNNVNLSLSGDDDATLTKYFEGLSAGGTVTQPLETAPWGDKFGMLTDKFGINWLVNVTAAKA